MSFRLRALMQGFFEIDGAALYLKAGTVLDYETQNSYDVTVRVDDPSSGQFSRRHHHVCLDSH